MRLILALADRANPYVEERKPWELRKDPARQGELQDVCTVALNLFRQLVIYLAPVLPRLARPTGDLLSRPIGDGSCNEAAQPLLGTRVQKFEHMLKRAEPPQVQALME